MGRALVIVAWLLVVWPASARADGLDDMVAGLASMGDNCQSGLEMADLLLEAGDLDDDELAQVENNRILLDVLCPIVRDSVTSAQETLAHFRACTEDCDDLEALLMLTLKKVQIEGDTVVAAMTQLQAISNGEGFVPDEDRPPARLPIYDVGEPETGELYLSSIERSILAPSGWVTESNGERADLIDSDGELIASIEYVPDFGCDRLIPNVQAAHPDRQHQPPSISLPAAWTGMEYLDEEADVVEWVGLYCRAHDGGLVGVSGVLPVSLTLVEAIEAALDPGTTGGTVEDEPYVQESMPTPARETPGRRGVLGAIMPRTVLLALVRRSDDMDSGFGFGLKLGRLGWREDHRFTIGYEVAAAATEGFWELSAQVRPGVSPMFKDLPANAYVVAGVDAIGGNHQPETDVAPVGGAGADVLFTLPGLGADVAGQVLADSGGFHSYTLHGGLLFGDDDSRVRLGATYVRFADESKVLWFTLGFTRLELN